LLTVRRFAITIQPENNQYEIPPANAFGRGAGKRRVPHIFSEEEVSRLLAKASQLKPCGTIRSKTYTTIFALLVTTGLRISEALALNVEDVTDDGLMIKCTKFRKDRLVPIHESTRQAIEDYLDYRKRYDGENESALFISNTGSRPSYSTVIDVFLQLLRAIGMRDESGTPGPCLHDLRHTFAVKSLEQCTGDNAVNNNRKVIHSTN